MTRSPLPLVPPYGHLRVAFLFQESPLKQPPSIVADLVQRLDDNLREDYEERAGIIEFDAAQPRELAEALALLDVLRRHPAALLGVTVLQVDLDGQPRFVVTTDVDVAHRQLSSVDGRVIRAVELSSVVRVRLGGLALLTRIG